MILDSFRLDGKIAIVTGCRSGIGQAIAVALAEAGADIVGVGSTTFADTRARIESRNRRFLGIQADLRRTAVIPEILEKTLAVFPRVDILVNNAGMNRRADSIDFTESDWDDVLSLNLKSAFFLAQAVARRFVFQNTPGKIINIASMLSFTGGIRCPAYAASKSALAGVTKTLANEWAKMRINVNAIAPGYFDTDLTAPVHADETRNREILARIPANRWGRPEDLAGMAVFLASAASDYVHGAVLAVDGGYLAR